MGINFRKLGFTKDFAGINFRELGLTKDFAGINFRERDLSFDFDGNKLEIQFKAKKSWCEKAFC